MSALPIRKESIISKETLDSLKRAHGIFFDELSAQTGKIYKVIIPFKFTVVPAANVKMVIREIDAPVGMLIYLKSVDKQMKSIIFHSADQSAVNYGTLYTSDKISPNSLEQITGGVTIPPTKEEELNKKDDSSGANNNIITWAITAVIIALILTRKKD